jgi:hypothetical protein
MIVAICGGDGSTPEEKVFQSLDYWMLRLKISAVVHDGRGVAAAVRTWAGLRRISALEVELSDEVWKKTGGSPGPIRNQMVLDRHKPERVIAFSGGADTADMLNQARSCGVKCIEVA